MDFHPIAEIFPMLSADELEALASDIKANGLLEPITIYEGKVLDGRNRYRACEIAEVAPVFVPFADGKPLEFVISKNLHRRHLSESQRSMVAAKLENIQHGGDRRSDTFQDANLHLERAEAAALLNVSPRSVASAKQVHNNGIPELIQAVETGDIAVSRAAEIAKEPPEVQQEQLAKPHVAYNNGNNEWHTPPEYIEAALKVFGKIDLDPASSDAANEIVKAKTYYTKEDDGRTKQWAGKVWMNPPYASDLIGNFADKLCYHLSNGDVSEAIVLVNNATETEWFNTLLSVSDAIIFPRGRVKFLRPDGTPGAPLQGQAIIYSGPNPEKFLRAFSPRFGWGAMLWPSRNG